MIIFKASIHKKCHYKEKLEEDTFENLHDVQDESTTLLELKKKFSRTLEIIICLHFQSSRTDIIQIIYNLSLSTRFNILFLTIFWFSSINVYRLGKKTKPPFKQIFIHPILAWLVWLNYILALSKGIYFMHDILFLAKIFLINLAQMIIYLKLNKNSKILCEVICKLGINHTIMFYFILI